MPPLSHINITLPQELMGREVRPAGVPLENFDRSLLSRFRFYWIQELQPFNMIIGMQMGNFLIDLWIRNPRSMTFDQFRNLIQRENGEDRIAAFYTRLTESIDGKTVMNDWLGAQYSTSENIRAFFEERANAIGELRQFMHAAMPSRASMMPMGRRDTILLASPAIWSCLIEDHEEDADPASIAFIRTSVWDEVTFTSDSKTFPLNIDDINAWRLSHEASIVNAPRDDQRHFQQSVLAAKHYFMASLKALDAISTENISNDVNHFLSITPAAFFDAVSISFKTTCTDFMLDYVKAILLDIANARATKSSPNMEQASRRADWMSRNIVTPSQVSADDIGKFMLADALDRDELYAAMLSVSDKIALAILYAIPGIGSSHNETFKGIEVKARFAKHVTRVYEEAQRMLEAAMKSVDGRDGSDSPMPPAVIASVRSSALKNLSRWFRDAITVLLEPAFIPVDVSCANTALHGLSAGGYAKYPRPPKTSLAIMASYWLVEEMGARPPIHLSHTLPTIVDVSMIMRAISAIGQVTALVLKKRKSNEDTANWISEVYCTSLSMPPSEITRKPASGNAVFGVAEYERRMLDAVLLPNIIREAPAADHIELQIMDWILSTRCISRALRTYYIDRYPLILAKFMKSPSTFSVDDTAMALLDRLLPKDRADSLRRVYGVPVTKENQIAALASAIGESSPYHAENATALFAMAIHGIVDRLTEARVFSCDSTRPLAMFSKNDLRDVLSFVRKDLFLYMSGALNLRSLAVRLAPIDTHLGVKERSSIYSTDIGYHAAAIYSYILTDVTESDPVNSFFHTKDPDHFPKIQHALDVQVTLVDAIGATTANAVTRPPAYCAASPIVLQTYKSVLDMDIDIIFELVGVITTAFLSNEVDVMQVVIHAPSERELTKTDTQRSFRAPIISEKQMDIIVDNVRTVIASLPNAPEIYISQQAGVADKNEAGEITPYTLSPAVEGAVFLVHRLRAPIS